MEDLIQEGFMGLTKCFDQFDPERGLQVFDVCDAACRVGYQGLQKTEKRPAPLDAWIIENAVDTASWTNYYEATPTRTSRNIRDCADRMTVHISPYKNGLAPETRDFIAELNAEAAQESLKVTYIGLANKIEVTGDIKGAAQNPTTWAAGSCGGRRTSAIRGARRGFCGRAIRSGESNYARSPSANKSPDTFCTFNVHPFKERE